jgi:hypothetical protein
MKEDTDRQAEILIEAQKTMGAVLDRIIHKTQGILSSFSERFQQRIDFARGIALGLFYGIVGNIFVSHYYQVFEGLILEKSDLLFWSNLTVFIISLLAILLVSGAFYCEMKKMGKARKEFAEMLKEFDDIEMQRLENQAQSLQRLLQMQAQAQTKK